MRILHTADLHLGRSFHGLPLHEDHAAILEQILAALKETRAQALIIAGDIFDRANPPAEAVELFNDFLRRAREHTRAAIVLLAGNHDSGARIDMMSVFASPDRALVRGLPRAREPALALEDAHGKVAFSALPFSHEYAARECFHDPRIASPADVLARQVAAARAAVPRGARWVVAAHAFVAGGEAGSTERALTRVGGIETVPADTFAGAHYVALGHLHRAQMAGANHIRYSGAPLAFDFSETGEKSLTFVELNGQGEATVELLPLTPGRGVRTLAGTLDELLKLPPSDDFIRAELTDETPRIDPMRALRERFPNCCQLEYVNLRAAPETKGLAARPRRLDDPLAVVEDFLRLLREEEEGEGEMSRAERETLHAALDALREREAGA